MDNQQKLLEELQWKTAFLEAEVDASLDGKLVVDSEAKIVLINKRLIVLFKIPRDIYENTDDAVLLKYVTGKAKDPERFLEKVKYLYAHPDETSHDELEFADGTVFDRYSCPVINKNGTYFGRIWTFRDITDRIKQEEALKISNEELKRLNTLMMGREKRIIELKVEVDRVLKSASKPAKYNA